MASNDQKQPTPPDPSVILGLQNQYNRTNSNSPFGSTNWSTGANGHETNTTTLGPQEAQAATNAFGLANKPLAQQTVPQGMSQLTSAILGKVGSHYGLNSGDPSSLNTNMKAQSQSPGAPQGLSGASQGWQGLPGLHGDAPGQMSQGQLGTPMQGGGMGQPMQGSVMGAPQLQGSGMGGMQSAPSMGIAPGMRI